MQYLLFWCGDTESVERPAIARVIGTLNYFERFTGTVVPQSFVFGLCMSTNIGNFNFSAKRSEHYTSLRKGYMRDKKKSAK